MSYELTPTPAMRKARKAIPWIPDEELPEVKFRSPAGTAALSVVLPGSAQLINGKHLRGSVVIIGAIGTIGLGLWIGMGGWVFALTAAAGSILARQGWQDAKAMNIFSAARESHRLNGARSQTAASQRLLQATSHATAPTQAENAPAPLRPDAEALHDEHAERIIQKLQQGYKLYRSGMLSGDEFRERKVEIFSSTVIVERDGMDSLMEALVPLFEEGLVDEDDLALLKAIADVPLDLTEF
jgi:hypothetical protein